LVSPHETGTGSHDHSPPIVTNWPATLTALMAVRGVRGSQKMFHCSAAIL